MKYIAGALRIISYDETQNRVSLELTKIIIISNGNLSENSLWTEHTVYK